MIIFWICAIIKGTDSEKSKRHEILKNATRDTINKKFTTPTSPRLKIGEDHLRVSAQRSDCTDKERKKEKNK